MIRIQRSGLWRPEVVRASRGTPNMGGILRDADAWGIKNVYEKLVELEKKYGLRFRPANLVKEMADSGKRFYLD